MFEKVAIVVIEPALAVVSAEDTPSADQARVPTDVAGDRRVTVIAIQEHHIEGAGPKGVNGPFGAPAQRQHDIIETFILNPAPELAEDIDLASDLTQLGPYISAPPVDADQGSTKALRNAAQNHGGITAPAPHFQEASTRAPNR